MSTEQTDFAPVKGPVWLRRRVLRSAIVIVAGLLLFYSKLTFDLTPWAQAVISSVTTATYGTEENRAKTTVLLFTEPDLAIARNRFPIPYDTHALVLSELAEARVRPGALFIDFAFVQPRRDADPAFQELTKTVCRLRNKDRRIDPDRPEVPVFVVDTREPHASPAQAGSVFGDCAEPAGAYVVGEEPAAGLMSYPQCGARPEPEPEHFGARVREWLAHQWGAHGSPCAGPDSAAFALWHARHGAAARTEHPASNERMALVWPAHTVPNSACATRSGIEPVLELFFDVYTEGAEAFKRACPYTQTVTVGQLMQDASESAKLLVGSTVFYGSKLTLGGDVVASPAYRNLPGVYYHAMAHDNLVNFDGHPKIETPARLKLFIALVLSLIATGLAFRKQHEPHVRSALESARYYGKLVVFVLVFVVIATGLLAYGALRGGVPELLVLACFGLYLCIRWITDRSAALLSLLCFLFALFLYRFFSISVDIFFGMILFLEVVHLMLHHLTAAAARIAPLATRDPLPRSLPRRLVFAVLDPFMPD